MLSKESLVPAAYNREALEALAFPNPAEKLGEGNAALAHHIDSRLKAAARSAGILTGCGSAGGGLEAGPGGGAASRGIFDN